MSQTKAILFLLLVILLFSCREREQLDDEVPYMESSRHLSGVMIRADFVGRVFNDTGNDGVKLVTIGSKSTYTDEDGNYFITNTLVDSVRAICEVNENGGFSKYEAIVPNAEGMNYLNMLAMRSNDISALSDIQAGVQYYGNTSSYSYPANAITDGSGNLYTGAAYGFSRTEDFSSMLPNLPNTAQGDFLGFSASGSLKSLLPYGVGSLIRVDDNFQELSLLAGNQISSSFLVPAVLMDATPETLPLWRFDEEATMWREVGAADLSINGFWYEFNTTRFGHYMVAQPYDAVLVSGRVVTEQSMLPVSHVQIRFRTDDIMLQEVFTDERGRFHVWLPASKLVEMSTLSGIGNYLYQEFVVAEANSDMGDIVVADDETAIARGIYVDCLGSPLSGYVNATSGSRSLRYSIPPSGEWAAVTQYSFGGLISMQDEILNTVTEPLSVYVTAGNEIQSGAHVSCELPSSEYLSYSINGSDELLVYDEVSFSSTSLPGSDGQLTLEFTGTVLGDEHRVIFKPLDYSSLIEGESPLIEPATVLILNSGTVLGSFESSEAFEFRYIGISPIVESNIMFEFEGSMNSLFSTDAITVTGVGVVKRPW